MPVTQAAASVRVVVEDADAEQYTEALAARFPAVRFIAIRSVEEMTSRLDELRGCQVLITKGRSMQAGILAELTGLRWVQSLIAGVDRFVATLPPDRGILLTSTTGMHAPQMAEMALTHLLVLARNVERLVLNKQRRAWERWNSLLLYKKTVAIVGLGTSGTETGRLCKSLGMHVIGVSRTAGGRSSFDEVHGDEAISRVAARADFLILTVAYHPQTAGLIDAAVLAAMKPTAFLVNIARGGIVDQDALVHALQTGSIAGAGLDVFPVEPLPDSSPLWTMPNVFITPHMAGMSEYYVEQG